MYKIKQLPKDFIVEEIVDYKILNRGQFYLFLLEKKNYTSMDALKKTAYLLKCRISDIALAGLKDKNAITFQYVSIRNTKKLHSSYSHEEEDRTIRLTLKGYRDEKLYPGCLSANRFTVIVRNITKKPKKMVRMVNYFGEQRFSRNNCEIGRLIVKKDFKSAAEKINILLPGKNKPEIKDNNYIGFMQKTDKKILQLYIHAYQSFLWNRIVEEYIKKTTENAAILMPGFGAEYTPEIKKFVDKILSDEELSLRDFIIRQFPELSPEGSIRNVFIDVNSLEISALGNDDLNKGMKKCQMFFTLPKGCYATEYIRQSFS